MAQNIPHQLSAVLGFFEFALDAQFFVADQFDVAIFLDEFQNPHGVNRGVGAEGDVGHAGRGIDLDHAVRRTQNPQPVHVDEGLRLGGQLAKAVHDFFEQAVNLIGVLGRGQLLVKRQAQVHVATIVIGQQGGGVQIDVGVDRQRGQQVGLLARLEGAHGFAEHLVVKLKTHFEHVAALVFAQHLARTPDFQVVHGQVKTTAQLFHGLNGLQTLLGLFGQALGVGHHQIGIGLVVAAPHTAAQLVQLGQAKFVGPTHHDGVGAGHVDAGFDDGRAQQQVIALGHKIAHHALQLTLGHLAVGHGNAGFGQNFLQFLAAVFDRLDLVVQEVNLPAALQFTQHGLADHAGALIAHKGLDGQSPLRCGGDHAEVSQAFQGHAQRARNRRGGQGQHIDLGAEGLHGLLVAHAKSVFFVDDQEAQVLELDRLAEQLVGAHHDVHRAIGQAFDGGVDFFGGAKAAHLGHPNRPFAETVHQGLVMLFGQQGGGGQKCHLAATRHGHKGRTQSDFGFAKPHIAANQPVHRARADHVLDHGMNGRALIGGFFKAKVGGKGFVVLRRVAECVAFAGGAAGIQIQQFGGGVAHLLGGAAFGLFPLTTAQLVQRRFVGADPGVAADLLELADRHIQHGLVGVLQVQKFLHLGLLVGSQVHVQEAPVAADAVLGMDHGVAHIQLGQILDEGIDITGLILFLTPPHGDAGGKQLGFRDQVQARCGP